MRQLIQSYQKGKLSTISVPAGSARKSHLLVCTRASLVSVGTEKYMLEMARKSLVGKALARPDLVRQVVAKAQAEGMLEAWRQAMNRLDTPVPLGYSSAGVVLDVGLGVEGFFVGDRVACTGSGYAGHAEVVVVPAQLCAKIPREVGLESAAFVALGGIALEAVRMARVSLGETVAVVGLGLLGQIAVQLLNAAGCRVFGIDIDPLRTEMALRNGAEATTVSSPRSAAIDMTRNWTGHEGADAVIILAASSSNEPLELAAEICRERGRIVAAGLVGLEIPRKPFYDKELELVVSRGWGPGLYDPNYTEKGLDYPIAYARWTAKRNMEAFLAQLARGAVRVDHLITHRFPFARALEAYDLILEGKEPHMGVLLSYPTPDNGPQMADLIRRVDLRPKAVQPVRSMDVDKQSTVVGLIGAGQFATGTLLPAMKSLRSIHFRGVATATGIKACHTAEKFGFDYCTTDHHEILNDPEINLVFVLTRHGSHAPLVTAALHAGKHVFVEKPLALSPEQLNEVVEAYREAGGKYGGDTKARSNAPAHHFNPSPPILFVGFNRRFSPFARWVKECFASIAEPPAVHCTINAGVVSPDHWVHDPEQGGGRIMGEICHFVDLIQYFTGSVPARVYAETPEVKGQKPSDNAVITLKMANGAVGSITYLAGGDKRYPRERVEVFGGGAVGVIENFKAATFTRGGRQQRVRNWLSVDRGHRGEIEALLDAIRRGGPAPVAIEEYVFTTMATLAIEESLRQGMPVSVRIEEPEGPGMASDSSGSFGSASPG